MTEVNFLREDVIDTLLNNKLVNVYFVKVNGDYREMNCTLHKEVLEKENAGSASSDDENYDPNQVRVFDTDIKQWRSFLLTNLIEITVK